MVKATDNKNIHMLYEGGVNMYAMADSQQRSPQNNLPVNDAKNSYGGAERTSNLPGGGGKPGYPASSSGSFSENEEVMVKGYGKMTKKQIKSMIDKSIDAIVLMKQNKKYSQIPQKLDMLSTLLKYHK